eukprot:3479088-Amphidinium_carterae.2
MNECGTKRLFATTAGTRLKGSDVCSSCEHIQATFHQTMVSSYSLHNEMKLSKLPDTRVLHINYSELEPRLATSATVGSSYGCKSASTLRLSAPHAH